MTTDDRVDATASTLRNWCERNHIRVFPDTAVCEDDAARLCGHDGEKPGAELARRIAEGLSVPKYRTQARRRFYRIRDIAEWLERGYDA